jgi:hypothetical protein
MFHLGKDVVPRLAEKGLFGRVYIRFGRLLIAGLWLYQTGAVLGRARRDRLETLAKMFSDPGREREASNWLQDLAAKRIDKYGREPESFFDFFMTTGYEKAGVSWPPASLDAIKRVDNEKIPLEQTDGTLKMFVLEGIGFGAKFPELTERMWKQTYETFDLEAWDTARRYGLDVPEEPTPLPLEQREQEVLAEVAVYATEHFPELVEPLGLRLS